MTKKTWAQKMLTPSEPKLERLDKPYAGASVGDLMLIPTPILIKEYVKSIPKGEVQAVEQLRIKLSKKFNAKITCPLTTGIFLRIVSEAALDELNSGLKDIGDITPFWRCIDLRSPLAKKLSCGADWIEARQLAEKAEKKE